MKASLLLSGGAGTYIDVGVVHVSLANLMIIATMVVVFVLAMVLPFPHSHDDGRSGDE